MYNTEPRRFAEVRTSTINKVYEIKDEQGVPYKFTRSKTGPKVIRDYSKHISKAGLEERIVILETRLHELDFLNDRIRDLENIIFQTIAEKKDGTIETRKRCGSSDRNNRRRSSSPQADLHECVLHEVQEGRPSPSNDKD